MNLDLHRVTIADNEDIKLAGVDGAGDATGPTLDIARWIAQKRTSDSVELNDFLASIYLIFSPSVAKYWPDMNSCRSYLVRQELSDQSREVLIREAWRWLCSGLVCGTGPVIKGRRTLISGRLPSSLSARPSRISDLVERLVAQAQAFAISIGRSIATGRSGKIGYPTIECVLNCLLLSPNYGEQKRLLESGIDVGALHRSLRNKM